nr:SRPBCC family protein [Halorubellus salinus]
MSPGPNGVRRRNVYLRTAVSTLVERVEVTTVVYADRQRVYDFLLDFPGYAAYSEHLKRVCQRGDGGPGTRYELQFAWWKLTYTAHSEVTETHPPERIDWRITKDIDATGHWFVESVDPPEGEDVATQVRFLVEYDADSAKVGNIDLPRFVSLSWVVEKVKPKIENEATRIVERVVVDLEGQRRRVELNVDTTPSDG